jgi:Cap4 SAVED domain
MPDAAELDAIGPIGDALLRSARGTSQQLSALLHDIEKHVNIDGTRVTFHRHCLKFDGNKRPRVDDLVSAISDHVLDFAVPRTAIAAAYDAYQTTGATAPLMRLRSEAEGLFTDLEKSGEGGELLLYVLAESVLRLPQLLCKMGLKTNTRMHVHGADGLHAGVDPKSGHLLLYWGESKLHANPTDAIRECFESIAPMLTSTGESGQGERDMQLLGRHADLADENLTAAIKTFLDPRHDNFNKLEFCGPLSGGL